MKIMNKVETKMPLTEATWIALNVNREDFGVM